jgi:hypothetical protein
VHLVEVGVAGLGGEPDLDERPLVSISPDWELALMLLPAGTDAVTVTGLPASITVALPLTTRPSPTTTRPPPMTMPPPTLPTTTP